MSETPTVQPIGIQKATNLRSKVDTMFADFEKFYDKGQKAAGKRLRSSISDLIKDLKAEKKESLEISRQRKNQA